MDKPRTPLPQLHPLDYEHPLDAKALDALESTLGLEKMTKAFIKHGVERFYRISYTGSNLRISEHNFPHVYDLLEEAMSLMERTKNNDGLSIPARVIAPLIGFINFKVMSERFVEDNHLNIWLFDYLNYLIISSFDFFLSLKGFISFKSK